MTSRKNDRLRFRTAYASPNYYDGQSCIDTVIEKVAVLRSRGYNFDIITNRPASVSPHMRCPSADNRSYNRAGKMKYMIYPFCTQTIHILEGSGLLCRWPTLPADRK